MAVAITHLVSLLFYALAIINTHSIENTSATPERIEPAIAMPFGAFACDFFTADTTPSTNPTSTKGIAKKLQKGRKEKIKPIIPRTNDATSM
jgi:hypothetical protein